VSKLPLVGVLPCLVENTWSVEAAASTGTFTITTWRSEAA